MKLKKLLESTPGYENRKFGDKLPTLDSVRSAYQSKQPIKEVEYGIEGSEFDYEGALDRITTAVDVIDGIEENLVYELDMIANDEAVYDLVRDKAAQAVNQMRRYINGAQKQIEGIRKMIDQAQRRGDYNV
jgi:hypothetical protein